MGQRSGIGVLDKAVVVLRAAAAAPCTLAELCERTGLPRATAHRLAVGLEAHRLLRARAPTVAGVRAPRSASSPTVAPTRCSPRPHVLPRLRDLTGESVQLYRRDG